MVPKASCILPRHLWFILDDMDGFPNNTEPLRVSLARALELKACLDEAGLVRSAEIDITLEDHDNWNGATDHYALRLRIPLEMFAKIEHQLKKIESRILEAVQIFWRGVENEGIIQVVIHPAPLTASGGKQALPTIPPSFWTAGQF